MTLATGSWQRLQRPMAGCDKVPLYRFDEWLARHPALLEGIAVFDVDCDAAAPRLAWFESVLDRAEHADIARLALPQHRRRMAITRGALRRVLGAYLGTEAGDVPLSRDHNGKPRLAPSRRGPQFQVSCSRSAAQGAFAISLNSVIGLDRETATAARFPDRLAPVLLSANERRIFAGIPAPLRAPTMARAWVCKEAVLKGLGLGLQIDPTRVEVSPALWCRADSTDGVALGAVQGLPQWAVVVEGRGAEMTALAVQGQLAPVHRVRLTL